MQFWHNRRKHCEPEKKQLNVQRNNSSTMNLKKKFNEEKKHLKKYEKRSSCKAQADWGHDELEWKRIVSALRLAGYDYVMSIEHEDALASVDEGLRAAVGMLRRVLLTEPPVEAWWT